MPVRVNPPPAETGETISPTWASFETAMPAKGARMVQLSTLLLFRGAGFRGKNLLPGQLDLSPEAVRGGGGGIEGLLGLHTFLDELLCAVKLISALRSWTWKSVIAACKASPIGFGGVQSAAVSESSSVARSWFSLRRVPSSKKTPVTRPVILAAMVARRRGVMYPLALRTPAGRKQACEREVTSTSAYGCDTRKRWRLPGRSNHGKDNPKPAPASAGLLVLASVHAQGGQVGLQGLRCCRPIRAASPSTGEFSRTSHSVRYPGV